MIIANPIHDTVFNQLDLKSKQLDLEIERLDLIIEQRDVGSARVTNSIRFTCFFE